MKKLVMTLCLIFPLIAFSGKEISLKDKQINIKNSLFNHLIGEWNIQDYLPDAQGQWQKGQGADWVWKRTLNGNAFQDNWISPPLGIIPQG